MFALSPHAKPLKLQQTSQYSRDMLVSNAFKDTFDNILSVRAQFVLPFQQLLIRIDKLGKCGLTEAAVWHREEALSSVQSQAAEIPAEP